MEQELYQYAFPQIFGINLCPIRAGIYVLADELWKSIILTQKDKIIK